MNEQGSFWILASRRRKQLLSNIMIPWERRSGIEVRVRQVHDKSLIINASFYDLQEGVQISGLEYLQSAPTDYRIT